MKRFLPLLLLAGCTVGPNYRPPEAATPPAFAGPQPAPTQQAPDLSRWWQSFGDPTLDALIAKALKDSPTIATAASRVRQARLQAIIAGAANKPTLDASAGASHVEFSKNAGFATLAQQFSGGGSGGTGTGGAPGGIALPGSGITTYSVGFDSSWEIDLFGGGRRGVEAEGARVEVAEWSARDAAVTLASEIAATYFQLRLDSIQIDVIEGELTRQRRANEIASNIAKAGIVPQNDVIRQRGSITALEAQIEPLRADVTVQTHALAVLLDEAPESFTIPDAAAATNVPIVPAGLPLDTIRRRPDVRAAERQLAAATADIGVATADLYPKIQLTGVADLISTALRTLFTGDSLQLTASGQATFPILDWGRRKANIGIKREDREQAYLAWRQTVLGALRDVEDALAQLDAERRRNATLARAVADRESSARSAEAQYRTGFVAQDSVLNAEAQLLSTREQVAMSEAQLRQQTVALAKALGGGWGE